jgi:cell division septation protein DedD
MAPLLIDGRDLLKFALVSGVTVIAVFSSGIFVGHQRAATFYQAGIDVQPLPLPERTMVADNALGSRQPSDTEAGEFIDVDHPESVAESVIQDTELPAMMSVSGKTVAIQEEAKAVPAKIIKQHKSGVITEVARSISLKQKSDDENRKNSVNAKQGVTSVQSDKDNAPAVLSLTTDDLDEVKYSIQVGMYGRLINAENMMKVLQVEQYEAYITDYTNKKNETRYNVRFGYFPDRRSALASLEKFKNDNKGDGYLVRFSAGNIVNLADAGKAGSPQVQVEEPEKSSKPAESSSVITTDKISQADVLTDTLIKSN